MDTDSQNMEIPWEFINCHADGRHFFVLQPLTTNVSTDSMPTNPRFRTSQQKLESVLVLTIPCHISTLIAFGA